MRVFNRVYGVKPGRDAPRLDRLLWFRGYYRRNFLIAVPVLVFLVLTWTWWWALVMVPGLLGYVRLEMEIRKVKAHL